MTAEPVSPPWSASASSLATPLSIIHQVSGAEHLGRLYGFVKTSTPPAWSGPPPEEIAAWNLIQVGRLIGRRFHREFTALGVTPTQFGVLLQLQLHPDRSNNEIARSVLVTPQSMSEPLESLESLGLIERDPPVGGWHRVAIRLTDAGRHRLHPCSAAVGRAEDSLGLTDHADRNSTNYCSRSRTPKRKSCPLAGCPEHFTGRLWLIETLLRGNED
ncbi:MarR family winged helix-turn-helix transcriptional regulator [Nakamurella sp. PAMC28650]|uniref:MarR family winged helix-turn-helix transcriptional regulator n=1 Tax=Nakamurella sp. PAMC28650 TaxID=2762325 RepID=UPI00164DF371|nr:MarR family winged helix-turn-helix transcriptional regulator [Nakamurella sp. PAMC28650]QNK80510.1 winged helix-turn-helix transcriptional regulator [Nakamurella sp. PAMC28650]